MKQTTHVPQKVREAVRETFDTRSVSRMRPSSQYDGAMVVVNRMTAHERSNLQDHGIDIGTVASRDDGVLVHLRT